MVGRKKRAPAARAGARSRYSRGVTVTLILAETSGRRRSSTSCSPVFLMEVSRATTFLSTSKPHVLRLLTMSDLPTEPKSLPSAPAGRENDRLTPLIFSASCLVTAIWSARALARFSLPRSQTLRAAGVASVASFLGSRKLRPKPSETSLMSPARPTFTTSERRMTFMLFHHVRQQRQVAGALDALGQLALVAGAGARDAGRQDLSALGQERAQDLDLLVVDVADLLGAETAHFAAHGEGRAAAAHLGAASRGSGRGGGRRLRGFGGRGGGRGRRRGLLRLVVRGH